MGKEQDRAITKPAEDSCLHSPTRTHVHALWYFGSFVSCPETQTWRCSLHVSRPTALPVCVECLFSRSPSRAPYRTPPACAKRATYSNPPPVVPHPESIAAQAAYPGRLRPELFPGVEVLPRPATESHHDHDMIVNRGPGVMCGSHKSPTEPHHSARAPLSPPQLFIEGVGLGPVSDL